MIDTDFITRYTTALYENSPVNSPRYDEFRDMFSTGQLNSKKWLVDEISRYLAGFDSSSVIIVGSWFGTLGLLLKNKFPEIHLKLLDVDPRCKPYVESVMRGKSSVEVLTQDMYDRKYNESLVINTSCEHIPDLKEWLTLVSTKSIVVLQSNNFFSGNGHISCCNSIEEFIEKAGLNTVWYSGELVMPMYTRYMIIGTI